MNKLDEKIAFFLHGLGLGGIQRTVLTLAEAFADRGYQVDLVVCNTRGPLRNEIPADVNLVDLRTSRLINSVPALVKYLSRARPSVMISAMSLTNCVAIWARKISRVQLRLVLSEHSQLSQVVARPRKVRMRILPFVMRHSYHKADRIVAVSEGVASDLAATIGLPRDRIKVIYNPVVTSRMLEMSREGVDHPWFHESQIPVILAAGRLAAVKDYPSLIEAFAIVRKKCCARLVIVGEGEERTLLLERARELGVKDDVDLLGFVKNPYAYMRAAAVFVQCSRWEGLGNALIEALACGIGVISTDCPGGPAEILENGKWGILVPVGDKTRLAEAIETELSATGDDVSCMRRQRAAQFAAETAANKYHQLLSAAMRK